MHTILSLVLAIAMSPAAWAGQLLIENHCPQPFLYQIRQPGNGQWTGLLAIPPGRQQRVPAADVLVIRFHNGRDWASYQLSPGKWFRYEPAGNGRNRFVEAGAMSDAAVTPESLASPEKVVATVLHNVSSKPWVYEVRESGHTAWGPPQTLAPGEHRDYYSDKRLVVRFKNGWDWTTRVLNPGRRLRYTRDAAGNGDLLDSRLDRPGRLETRHVAVLAVADATYRRQFPDWQDRIAEIVATVSSCYEEAFAIRLRLVGCRPWQYEATMRGSLNQAFTGLLGVAPLNADLVVGWIGIQQETEAMPESWKSLAHCRPFGHHVLIVDDERRELPWATLLLARNLAKTFGAFRVTDQTSLMRPYVGTTPFDLDFGGIVRQVILLSREFDFHVGVESLNPEHALQILDLYTRYRHPDDSPADDPITRGHQTKELYNRVSWSPQAELADHRPTFTYSPAHRTRATDEHADLLPTLRRVLHASVSFASATTTASP